MHPQARIVFLAVFTLLCPAGSALPASGQSPPVSYPAPQEGTWVAHDFHLRSGESLPELKLHYRTIGTLRRDAQGRAANAVLILHGTGGTGGQFLAPYFAGVLFGPGQPLDATRFYIILPDGIGAGGSSKPSDGLHARFPHYNYEDMVRDQHLLVTEGLHVDHLRLVMGTSMGCMHSFLWGEMYPEFSDALMPLACNTVAIAGRNRMMRRMIMDAITRDPAWNHGEYTTEPPGLRTAEELLLIMGSSPLQMQEHYPTAEAADRYLAQYLDRPGGIDANDELYQVDASRDYDPSSRLGTIRVPVMYVNSADDFVNPPELGIAERNIRLIPRGRFVLLPTTEETRGHGTHTMAAVWKSYLIELLAQSEPAGPGAPVSSRRESAGSSE